VLLNVNVTEDEGHLSLIRSTSVHNDFANLLDILSVMG
jgi:hypothetical protein